MQPPWRYFDLLALEHRNFQYYTVGQIINLAGTRIQEVGAGWLMWQLTGSATWVGVLAVTEMVPRLVLWLVAGALADRVDRRKLAIFFQSLAATAALSLAVLSGAGLIDVYSLLAFTAVFGVCSAFWQPIRFAIIPRLVPREALASAIALSSVSANVARVVGPMIAGPVLIWGSATLAFALNAVSFLAVVIAFWLMVVPAERPASTRTKMSARELSLGLSIILHDPGVRMLIVFIAIFAICVRPAGELLPVFAEAVFAAGPAGLAALVSAFGLGSLFSGLVVSGRQQAVGLTTVLATAGILGSVMTAAFAMAPTITVGMACIAVMGFGVTLKNIVGQILLQLALSDHVRGRVLSIYGVLFTATPGLGALIMGWFADRLGIAAPVLVGAAIGMASSVLLFLARHRLALLLDPVARSGTDGKVSG